MIAWSSLLRRLGSLRRHPDFVQLVAWHEGELDDRELVWITRHVLACPKCGFEAGLIGPALEQCSSLADGAEAPVCVERGVENLLCILRDPALLSLARERFRRGSGFRLAETVRRSCEEIPGCPEVVKRTG